MLKGCADAHVVFGLVQALRQRGMDVIRLQDCGCKQADDIDLLDATLAADRGMLTNDTDFLVLAAERGVRQERFAAIFFWPQQRRSIGQFVQSIIREASPHGYDAACSQGVLFVNAICAAFL